MAMSDEELRDGLVRKLRLTGHASNTLDDLRSSGVEAAEWRRAARAAGRQLGRPVQTLRVGSDVWAQLTDWPANPLEAQIHQAALRRAASAMSGGAAPGPSVSRDVAELAVSEGAVELDGGEPWLLERHDWSGYVPGPEDPQGSC